jgi:hypothetical protein
MSAPINTFSGIERVPNAQTPDLRSHEVRRLSYIEGLPNRTSWLHSAYWTHTVSGTPIESGDQTALPATEGASTWGDEIKTVGYERLVLLLTLTQGAATSWAIAAQSSPVGGGDAHWYDYHDDRVTPGAVVRRVWTQTVTGDMQLSFVIEPQAMRMRFKVWAPGANAASRALLQGIRLQNAS